MEVLPLDDVDKVERDRETSDRLWQGLFAFLLLQAIGVVILDYFVPALNQRPEDTPWDPVWRTLLFISMPVLPFLMLRGLRTMRRWFLTVALAGYAGLIAFAMAKLVHQISSNPKLFETQESATVTLLFVSVQTLYALLLFMAIVPAARIVLALWRRVDVSLAKPVVSTRSAPAVLTLFGWPPHVPMVNRKRILTFVLFALSSITFLLAFFLPMNVLGFLLRLYEIYVKGVIAGTPTPLPYSYKFLLFGFAEYLVEIVLLMLLLVYASRWLERRARARLRFTMTEALRTDERRPVVFLRSFEDDQVGLGRSGLAGLVRLLEIGRGSRQLDEIVLEEAYALGPVVALGRPGEAIPPYGAARDYFEHGDWQSAVSRLCQDASAITFCLDETEGVQWEFAHIAGSDAYLKTLFIPHPRFLKFGHPAKLLSDLAGQAARLGNSTLADALSTLAVNADCSVLAYFFDAGGNPVCVRAAQRSPRQYRLMVRAFVRRRSAPAVALEASRDLSSGAVAAG